MQTVAFGYTCQECGRGTVQERRIPAYDTKIKGYPFVVKDARIGVCDLCGAEHFAAQETKRWERMFEEEHARHFLTPEDVKRTRKSLDLTMEQFAFLTGCTRQSLYNWERADRSRPQSRMADLIMKLVRESHQNGKVDVLRFLVREAEQFGVRIQLRGVGEPPAWKPVVLPAKRVPSTLRPAGLPDATQMAAKTTEDLEEWVIVLSPETNEPVGRLFHDFRTASLKLELAKPLEFGRFRVEVRFADGTVEQSEAALKVEGRQVTLIERTRHTEDEVSEIVLVPYGTNDEPAAEKR